jgi:hypothetical protein
MKAATKEHLEAPERKNRAAGRRLCLRNSKLIYLPNIG